MSVDYTTHDCKCEKPQLGIISHGKAYCSVCEGFLADIDDIDLLPNKPYVVKREKTNE